MHIIINRSGWLVAGVLALFVVAAMTGVVSGGPLDPPGAPSSSTSGVLSPGTPITSVPFTISSGGYYYLTDNLSSPGSANAITIQANDVTLDLRGFTLASPDQIAVGILAIGQTGITVEHGQVRGFSTALWLGAASFVTDTRVRDFGGTGIEIGDQSLIDGCMVTQTTSATLSGFGISVGGTSVVRNCVVSDLPGSGVLLDGFGAVLESSQITGNDGGPGTYGVFISGLNATLRDNTLENGSRDIRVFANAATIIDNAIHCAASISNGGFSYYAPVAGEAHANVPRYGVGFC